MGINRLTLTSHPSGMDRFMIRKDDAHTEFDLNPPYQRGHVWGAARQRALIESLLTGVPVGTIIIGDRWPHMSNYPEGTLPDVIIDGKQRITAIRAFCASEFTVPRSWWEDNEVTYEASDKEELTFAELTDLGQRKFKRTPILVSEGIMTSMDAERRTFDLINFGGVPQGKTDFDSEDFDEQFIIDSPEFQSVIAIARGLFSGCQNAYEENYEYARGVFELAAFEHGLGGEIAANLATMDSFWGPLGNNPNLGEWW